MKCAIMQPTYLPWIGYFHMIAKVDIFIFFDDVQFSKRSWQQRNKILYNSEEKWITIPVHTKGLRLQKINEVAIDNTVDWKTDHIQLIKHAYSKAPFYYELNDILKLYNVEYEKLSDFTIILIKMISQKLGFKTSFINSSDLPVEGKRSKYLLSICEYINATEYLSAAGSKEYIESELSFSKSKIKVNYHKSEPYIYEQSGEEQFIPYLSVIDYIANHGFEGLKKEVTA